MEKVKLLQGNFERAEEISKTLGELGGVDKNSLTFRYEDSYYYVDQFGICRCLTEENAKEFVAKGIAEIYKLPQLKPKCILKPFDKVLVRDFDADEWRCDFFSHYRDGLFYCVGNHWEQCVKYEGNEYLLGTSKEPERCD